MPDASAPTERFSQRADDDIRHRPGYPPVLLEWLHRSHGTDAGRHVVVPRCASRPAALRGLFERTAVDGQVDLDYDARVFAGNLS